VPTQGNSARTRAERHPKRLSLGEDQQLAPSIERTFAQADYCTNRPQLPDYVPIAEGASICFDTTERLREG
jgi:hypothetical protein